MRFFAVLIGCLLLVTPPALADGGDDLGLSGPDRDAIRGIISAQLQAFKRDDGEAAFGYASPTIHKIFQSIDNFMAMVKASYYPVYRSEVVNFGEVLDVNGEPVQRVHIVGEDGRSMVAAYVMQRQPDGAWKINGVYMFKDDAEAT
ncbi:MAG: DUF4864 domain-containing protein [Proteobacteria bacterium]|nr:DUF4864 domain-containing protein [Pseudomonadota bacterium]